MGKQESRSGKEEISHQISRGKSMRGITLNERPNQTRGPILQGELQLAPAGTYLAAIVLAGALQAARVSLAGSLKLVGKQQVPGWNKAP